MKLFPILLCLLVICMGNWATVKAKFLSSLLPADAGDMAEPAVSKQDLKSDMSEPAGNQKSNQSENSGIGNENGYPTDMKGSGGSTSVKGSSASADGGIIPNVAVGATKGTATFAGNLTKGTVSGTATIAKDATTGALSPITTTISSLLAPILLPIKLFLFPIKALIYPIIQSINAIIFLTGSTLSATTVFAENVARKRRSTENGSTDDTFSWWNMNQNHSGSFYLTTMARFFLELLPKTILPWANRTVGKMMKSGGLPSHLIPFAKAFENMCQVLELLGYVNTNP